jgi:ubiquinone/menaquinone biosynthesis C-methylase UbiE
MRLTNPTMDRDDAPFPSVAPRNWLQESIELPALLTALAVPTGGRLLEVGCGRGVALPIFNRRLYPASITGIDVDQSALADARARAHATGTRVDLRHADVRQLPFPAGAFDIVFDFGTCFHIADPDRALREIARVLRPGGRFVTETVFSQLLAHPLRTKGKPLPWRTVPSLQLVRHAGLWQLRRKT